MIEITTDVSIDEDALAFEFVRASGPGGQNVNKVSTAVQLRFDLAAAAGIPDPVRERLVKLAGRRLNAGGILVIDARRYRTQERNRQDALDRLVALVRRAAEKPRPRKPTRKSRSAERRRLEEKRRRSDLKAGRRRVEGKGE